MKLPILQYGDPILREKCKQIDLIDNRIRALSYDMLDTMKAANGVGLAAPQVGEALRIIVVDTSLSDPRAVMPVALINPEIELGDETEIGTEGCLSFPPGFIVEIVRAKSVMVRSLNKLRFKATGLLARVLQHEVDHLNGILISDLSNCRGWPEMEL